MIMADCDPDYPVLGMQAGEEVGALRLLLLCGVCVTLMMQVHALRLVCVQELNLFDGTCLMSTPSVAICPRRLALLRLKRTQRIKLVSFSQLVALPLDTAVGSRTGYLATRCDFGKI